MNHQHKNHDEEEAHLARSPSFRYESKGSIPTVQGSAGNDSDGEFEFSIGGTAFPFEDTADEIFANGQILPVYPVFNQGLLKSDPDPDPSVQLGALLIADRAELRSGSQSSTSSADSDSLEIEATPAPGTYCEWTPGSAPQSPSRVKKSSSTGSVSASRKWRDLVARWRRSNSDGKQKFLFLNDGGSDSGLNEQQGSDLSPIAGPKGEEGKKKDGEKKKKKKAVKEMDMVTAHKLFYGKEKKNGENKVRRSFLPYKPELVPLFSNIRTHHLHPF